MYSKQKKKGISLIVLTITIIVMIILGTVIILSINNSGIIEKANDASSKSSDQNLLQAANAVYSQYIIDNRFGELDDKTVEEYIKDKLKENFDEDQIKKVNILSDGTIQILPKIPTGFVMSGIPSEQKVSEGLVIYKLNEGETTIPSAQWEEEITVGEYKTYKIHTERDQYVWIPVNDISEFVTRDGYLNGSIQLSVSNKNAKEPYSTSSYTTEVEEYNKMKESVKKHGGFYIARYEAGTTNRRTDKANGTSTDVLSQKDKFVYNYVGWGVDMVDVESDIIYSEKNQGSGAVKLARSLYPENNSSTNVVSTLCYGVQWDATIKFMQDVPNVKDSSKKYIKDSKGMGWYSTNSSENPQRKTGIDVDEKASNMVKNIYDMAGNVSDLTMESSSGKYRVFRGGRCYDSSSEYSASSRYTLGTTYSSEAFGFRIALYLK